MINLFDLIEKMFTREYHKNYKWKNCLFEKPNIEDFKPGQSDFFKDRSIKIPKKRIYRTLSEKNILKLCQGYQVSVLIDGTYICLKMKMDDKQ